MTLPNTVRPNDKTVYSLNMQASEDTMAFKKPNIELYAPKHPKSTSKRVTQCLLSVLTCHIPFTTHYSCFIIKLDIDA